MQWTNEPQAGFSLAARTVLPVIKSGIWSYERINVAKQRHDPNSLFNWTVRMIRHRKECPELGWGSWRLLNPRADGVLALLYQWRNNSIVTLHNFSEQPKDVSINVNEEGGDRLINLLSDGDSTSITGRTHRLALEPYGYRWYRVGGLGYIQRREKY
jgi:maltose alpha-D-glucosyltransferase/alpha-amylase